MQAINHTSINIFVLINKLIKEFMVIDLECIILCYVLHMGWIQISRYVSQNCLLLPGIYLETKNPKEDNKEPDDFTLLMLFKSEHFKNNLISCCQGCCQRPYIQLTYEDKNNKIIYHHDNYEYRRRTQCRSMIIIKNQIAQIRYLSQT